MGRSQNSREVRETDSEVEEEAGKDAQRCQALYPTLELGLDPGGPWATKESSAIALVFCNTCFRFKALGCGDQLGHFQILCLQRKCLNRRSKQESHNKAGATNMNCTFHKHCLLVWLLIAVFLHLMQRGWIKFKWQHCPFSHQRMKNCWQWEAGQPPHLPVLLLVKQKAE